MTSRAQREEARAPVLTGGAMASPSSSEAARALQPSLAEWLWLVVGLVSIHHYRWLIDDAFVYLRYVDNLVELDRGLVYNPGESVEGFSSPLYCAVLVALRALGLEWSTLLLGVSLTSWALFWVAGLRIERRLAPASPLRLNLPLALVATNYGALSFFGSGLETPLVQLAAAGTALYLTRPASRALSLGMALLPLLRPELALALALMAGFAAWRLRRPPWFLLGSAALAGAALLAARITYYADLLPNTYYLKGSESHWAAGWRYGVDTAVVSALLPVSAVLLGAVGFVRWRRGVSAAPRGADAVRLAAFGIAAALVLHVLRVGGTHVHFWYLAFPHALACFALGGLVDEVAGPVLQRRRLAALAVAGVAVAAFAARPRQLDAHPWSGRARHTPQHAIDDPLWHRNHRELRFDRVDALAERALRRARESRRRSDRAVIATPWCREAYAKLDQDVVHAFGLTDAMLARVDSFWFKPGHKVHLSPMADELVVLRRAPGAQGPGALRRAVAEGRAPDWVAEQIDALEAIERRIYNRHRFGENLALVAQPVPRLRVPERLQ